MFEAIAEMYISREDRIRLDGASHELLLEVIHILRDDLELIDEHRLL